MGSCKKLQCFRVFSVAVMTVCSVTGAVSTALARITSGALALALRSMRRVTPVSDVSSRTGARTSRSRPANTGTNLTCVGPARSMSESGFDSMRRATMCSRGVTSLPQRCSDHGITVQNTVRRAGQPGRTQPPRTRMPSCKAVSRRKTKAKAKAKARAGGKGGGKGKGKEGKGKGGGKGDGKGKGKEGKGKEGKGNKKLPDWQCTQCDALNRHWRDECYKLNCQASKIGNSKTVSVIKKKKQKVTCRFTQSEQSDDDEPQQKKHKSWRSEVLQVP